MAEGAGRIPPVSSTHRAQQAAQARGAQQASVYQEAAQEAFSEWAEFSAFNPLSIRRKFEKLEDKIRKHSEKASGSDESDENIIRIEAIKKSADQLQREHPDLSAEDLIDFLKQLEKGLSSDDALKLAMSKFGDPSLADKALGFASKNGSTAAKDAADKAQAELMKSKGREVKAGHNIASEVYSNAVLGAPTYLRELYRDATGNFLTANDLFKNLLSKYDFMQMAKAIDFMLGALGKDLNSGGPSINLAQLKSIFNDCQSLQAILGVYTFFYKRMSLIASEFRRFGMPLPSELNFQQLSQVFMRLIDERYPSGIKILNFAPELGLNNELIGQSVAFSQMRDAMRGTSKKLFRDEQHRQDLLDSTLEALEEIENMLDEEEDESEHDSGEEAEDKNG